MPTRLRRISSFLAYVAFLAVISEIALQAFYYVTAGDFLFRRQNIAMWESEEHAGIANRRNFSLRHRTNEFDIWIHNNSKGFRVPRSGLEFAPQKREDSYRVMLIGASFAYGWGVDYEDTVAAVLERELEAGGFADGRDVEIINAGVPSLADTPHLRWYEHVGSAYAPDLVIQFVYGSMAVVNDPFPQISVTDEGYLVPAVTPGQRVRDQLKKFASVFYAWVVWTQWEARRDGASGAGEREVLGAGREMKAATRFDLASPEVRQGLAFYRDLDRVVRRGGSDLAIVYFPLSYAIHREDGPRWKHLGVVDVPAQIAFDAAFVQHLAEQGMPALDVTDALQRAAEEGERLYYYVDIHWTPKGNHVAARAIADYLLAQRPPAEAIPAPAAVRSSRPAATR